MRMMVVMVVARMGSATSATALIGRRAQQSIDAGSRSGHCVRCDR